MHLIQRLIRFFAAGRGESTPLSSGTNEAPGDTSDPPTIPPSTDPIDATSPPGGPDATAALAALALATQLLLRGDDSDQALQELVAHTVTATGASRAILRATCDAGIAPPPVYWAAADEW